jgi:DNA polymerase-3 subunit delta'
MPRLLEIVSQDGAIAKVEQAFAGPRRPHAFIFAGPIGVGRRTTAVEFAKLLLCAKPVSSGSTGLQPVPLGGVGSHPMTEQVTNLLHHQACEQCNSCRTMQAGTNPDFQLIYKELAQFHDDPAVRDRKMQDLSIDVVRDFLIAPACRHGAGGHGKVFVVRETELMSVPAQNALLKTLEEPPPGVTIILVATSEEDLLPTIRSRCQIIRFGPLDEAFVAAKLAEVEITGPEAMFWARLSGGSIGRAKQFAREKLYEFKRQLVDALAALAPGKEGELSDLLIKQMDKLSKRFTGRDESLSASVAARQAGELLLLILGGVYRDAAAVACGANRPLINADQADAVRHVAGRFDPTQLAAILEQLARCEQLLWRNVNVKLLMDNIAITCASATAMEVG